MPPKKIEQQLTNPTKNFYVLPLFMNDSTQQSEAEKILRTKPINLKKCIDKSKIIEILKEKGLAQYLTPEGQVKSEGRKFISQNFRTVLQQATLETPKLADKKGPDPKKKGVAEIPVEQNKEPIVEFNMERKCENFIFLLDFPQTPDELKACIENGLKIDAAIVIQEKTKKGSNPPNYDLLGKNYQQNELMSTLNGTKIKQPPRIQKSAQQQQISRQRSSKKLLKTLRNIKSQNPEFSNLIIAEIPFEKDIAHPENDESNFMNYLFTNLCSTTVEKQKYENWVKNKTKKTPMIEPYRQVVKKQVLIENQQKAAGKKDANKEPEYETVEEVVQKKYESLPENVKSDLKIYKHLSQVRSKNHQNQLKNLVENCLLSVELQLGNEIATPSINPQNTFEKQTSKPLAKVNFIDTLKQNLRKVQRFSQTQLVHNLIHQSKEIQQKVSLSEIIHKNPQNKQALEFQYIINIFTEFLKQQQPKLKLNFSDRVYREKLSKVQVLSEIQNQLLRDPKLYEGLLKQDNIKLLCLAKINPPGRILYSNDIFKPKAVPDFENWIKNSKSTSPNEINEFWDYTFEEIGNLSLKRQKLTPTDNVVICDEKVSIGNDLFKINNFEKLRTFYGIKQLNAEANEFWLKNTQQNLSLSIFHKQHQFKKSSIVTEIVKEEGSEEEKTVEKIVESFVTQKRLEMWIRTNEFIISHCPYPTIFWLTVNRQNRVGELRRQFGPKGQITSYLNDGSVKVFYLNGNTSTFKNNQWERVINNEILVNNAPTRKLEIRQLTEGDKTIKIREDQTIFVEYSNGNSLVIFNDDTKVLYKKKDNIYEIKTYNPQAKEEIVVRIFLPNNSEVNVIGHGSAFAYLGFKNLLQRCVDGFLYEVWHNKFSTHLYNEKYEYENKIYEDEIRLVHLNDGSLIKVEAMDHISLVQGNYDTSEDSLREKWNHLFALQQSHEVGVYDTHLTEGSIKTKDAESNCFKINVQEQNEIDIAVSFKISDDEKITNNFGNGFHVPEQNFFLPVPDNSLPPRIFTFDNVSHEYYEYLTPQQVRQMEVSSSIDHTESTYIQNKTIQQYTKQMKKRDRFDEDKKVIAFSQVPSSKDYEIPGILLPRQTRINMSIENDPVLFRCIEKVEWNKAFQNITVITETILKQKEQRMKEFESGRN